MTYQASIAALIDQPPLLPKIELSLLNKFGQDYVCVCVYISILEYYVSKFKCGQETALHIVALSLLNKFGQDYVCVCVYIYIYEILIIMND